MRIILDANIKRSLGFGAVTSTTNGTGVDLQGTINPGGRGFGAWLAVSAASGTSPTCDVKIQESDDNSTFTDITGATFTQLTTTSTGELIQVRTNKRYVRAVATLAGTSPSFTMACVFLFGNRKS